MRASVAGVVPVPLFNDDNDPAKEVLPSVVRLERGTWERLDRIAGVETDIRKKAGKKPAVIYRNDVIKLALERFLDAYERENAELLKKSKR